MMYSFILNMWIMKRVSPEEISTFVEKGFITQEEADNIMSASQVS